MARMFGSHVSRVDGSPESVVGVDSVELHCEGLISIVLVLSGGA